MLNNNSAQFPPPVMSHHRPFDPTITSTTGMAQTNNASTAATATAAATAVNREAENSNHHLNPHQQQHHNINITTTPVDPINPTTTSSSSSRPADDDITTTNTNTAITILHHFKNGIEDMMESGGVIEPLPTDVICGRGKMTSSHPANRRFRELVDFHKRAYQNSKRRDEKTRITCDLVDQLRSEGR
ncbi:hypothetical protein FRACYDRAFT_248599 [Fragilariopsis cylindrus CCMP1102]|uniref:DUF6824 domain-containing protein n=1 Tax=Fragilariopsis cylindrus CCMP1102 TaxID=635003 RepID=A0A1E7EUQ3_9STRA|nr:hypothetical protein FRACYDRAFT_248599 [Fragilariopsis cylindrus CCMP1102]|eukprot:OEU09263.1 hypothetical protein FRACYDRAFT_248599 [Fragilariopsis cylindrus CCMP1102]